MLPWLVLGNPRLLARCPILAARANAVQKGNAHRWAAAVAPYLDQARRAGATTLAQMAEALMARGVPAPRGGRHWSSALVVGAGPACVGDGHGRTLTLLAYRLLTAVAGYFDAGWPSGLPVAPRCGIGPPCVPGIDAASAPHYLTSMRGLLRTVLFALILASAAGTALHAARAATMDLAMAAAASTSMAMPGCDRCGEDGDDNPGSAMGSCAALCATPPMAPSTAGPQVGASAPAAAEPAPGTPTPAGLTGPPDLHPPRTIVLS